MMMKGVAGGITDWVRPHVPEASDGILTSAGISEGFAAAGVGTKVLIFAGFAAIVAGALAAGAVEYSTEGAERDQQIAELTSERAQLAAAPDAELDELTQLYVSRGLSRRLAQQVAIELTAHDALAAHAEAEHGIKPTSLASPLRDALVVAPVNSSGVAGRARLWCRRGRGRRRSRGPLAGCRRGSRWAGRPCRSRRGWRGGWRSPRCWRIRRSGA